VEAALREHERSGRARLEKLWSYFRNPLEPVGPAGMDGPRARLAQERGLPARLTGGSGDPRLDDRTGVRREVVIENDIGWRVQAMVDFLFGRPVRVVSTAGDAGVRGVVERVVGAAWEASGGIGLLQDAALLGHVYGHVDFVVRVDEAGLRRAAGLGEDPAEAAARWVRIEAVEPTRGVAVLAAEDYREIEGYGIRVSVERGGQEGGRVGRAASVRGWLGLGERLGERSGERRRGQAAGEERDARIVTEVFGPGWWERRAGETVEERRESVLLPGVVPVVHVQNMSQPFRYSGFSEVEGLIPLQDELNTRLSDRASRVTMQSFQMYLAKGLEGFDRVAVGPGAVWSTDNPDAEIVRFGGDGQSPSEERHIEEIREAMDKISGVPPLAGGVVRAKLGNLSSATALRITLMGLIAKTQRKRVTYGRGIERVSGLVIGALHAAGVVRVGERDRGLRIVWPELLPEDPREELAAAKGKLEIGVPAERVLGELGYAAAGGSVDEGIA
jgi:hypothetical protein